MDYTDRDRRLSHVGMSLAPEVELGSLLGRDIGCSMRGHEEVWSFQR